MSERASSPRQPALIAYNVSLRDTIAELDRELKVRERLYPEWIKSGKIKDDVAAYRLDAIRTAHRCLIRYEEILRFVREADHADTNGSKAP